MSPANITDSAKVQVQRKAQATMARIEGRNRSGDRGFVARQMVRSWSPEQRARIKLTLLRYQALFGAEGELEVVKLIDQINEEERIGAR